jgi:proteasome lid subunit RPN8/RPN11
VHQLTLTESQAKQLIAHAQTEAPLEACGILGGENGRVLEVYPAVNALASPNRYQMEPEQLFSIFESMEARGWGGDPLAIYHSHPHGPETPSETDVAESYYANSVYVIIAHLGRPRPSLRGFWIRGGQVSEIELRIMDDSDDSVQNA